MSKQTKPTLNNELLLEIKTVVVSLSECLQQVAKTQQNMNEMLLKQQQSEPEPEPQPQPEPEPQPEPRQQSNLTQPKTTTLVIIVLAVFIVIWGIYLHFSAQLQKCELNTQTKLTITAAVCGNKQDYYAKAYVMCQNRYQNATSENYFYHHKEVNVFFVFSHISQCFDSSNNTQKTINYRTGKN